LLWPLAIPRLPAGVYSRDFGEFTKPRAIRVLFYWPAGSIDTEPIIDLENREQGRAMNCMPDRQDEAGHAPQS